MSLLQSLGLSLGVLGLRRPSTLFPWRRAPTPGRVRRAWVIPPISVSENHKRLPYPLVQVRGRGQSGQSQGWLSSWVPEHVCFKRRNPWSHRLSCPPSLGEGPGLQRGRDPSAGGTSPSPFPTPADQVGQAAAGQCHLQHPGARCGRGASRRVLH